MSKLIDFHKSSTEDLLEIGKVGGKNIIFWEDEIEFEFRDWKTGKLGSSLLKDSIDFLFNCYFFLVFCK